MNLPFTIWQLNAMAGLPANTSFAGSSYFLSPAAIQDLFSGNLTFGLAWNYSIFPN